MVEVHLFGAASAAVGTTILSVEASSVAELKRHLGDRGGPRMLEVLARSSLLVDGIAAKAEVDLRYASRVDVLPPFAGG